MTVAKTVLVVMRSRLLNVGFGPSGETMDLRHLNHDTPAPAGDPRCWRLVLILVVAAAVGGFPLRGYSQLIAEGAEFQVNSFTTSVQEEPDVASRGLGDFVVVWTSSDQDGSGRGVFAQRFDVTGSPLGGELQASETTMGDQHAPAVTVDGDGTLVLVWQGAGDGIRARRFDNSGTALGGDFQVNTGTEGDQSYPAVVAGSDGGFLVVWEGLGAGGILQSDIDILGQMFDPAGQTMGSEFRVNTYTTAAQLNPQLAVAGDGTFVVTWQSYGDGGFISTDRTILAQRLASDGSASGTEFQVNTYTTGKRSYPRVAVADDGGFAVVWQDDAGRDGSGKGVFARAFDSGGASLGPEFRVNAHTTGSQYAADIAAVGDGFVVVWSSTNFGSLGQDGDAAGVFTRTVSSSGVPQGSDVLVNSYTTGSQHHPVVDATGSGIVVAWTSDGSAQDGDAGGVFGQRFMDDAVAGSPCGDPVPMVADAGMLVATAIITASDSLSVLKSAVGLSACALCVCDVDGSGTVTASDALLVLKFAVGQTVVLSCPVCP